MWAYALATLRDAAKRPGLWILAALGLGVASLGARLGILAIGEDPERLAEMARSTGHLVGVLGGVWVLGVSLEEDRWGGLQLAGDAAGPGPGGRLIGRWLGACTLGTRLAVLAGGLGSALGGVTGSALGQSGIYLLITSIMAVGLALAWAVMLGARGAGSAAAVGTLLLWLLGHMPWASGTWLGGALGRILAAWLPGPRSDATWEVAGYTACAVLGLLLLTLARARPSGG